MKQRTIESNFSSGNENLSPQRTRLNYLSIVKNMRLEEDLRKIRHFRELKKSMKKQKSQISDIEQQLDKVERLIKQKKQSIIKKKLEELQSRKKERAQFISQTNRKLSEVKQKNQQKSKNIQKFIKQVQSKQAQKYQKLLKDRINRYRNPINFDQIKQHEKSYLHLKSSVELQKSKFHDEIDRKKSIRVKSEIGNRYQNEFENLSNDHKSILDERIKDEFKEARTKQKEKKLQIIKLIQKRNEYGNRVQKQKKTIRVKTQPPSESKRQKESRILWQKIQKQNESVIYSKKPKLDTNLPPIDLKECTKLVLKKINDNRRFSTLQKFQKLKQIEDSYVQRLKSNNPQAIDIISQLSLIKADLYLQY